MIMKCTLTKRSYYRMAKRFHRYNDILKIYYFNKISFEYKHLPNYSNIFKTISPKKRRLMNLVFYEKNSSQHHYESSSQGFVIYLICFVFHRLIRKYSYCVFIYIEH
jgi:hypothetical protein